MTTHPEPRSPDEPLAEAADEAAGWLEAEADHPRSDPRPAMRRQAARLRAALAVTRPEPDLDALTAAIEELPNIAGDYREILGQNGRGPFVSLPAIRELASRLRSTKPG
jgi:hypothetical protein